MRRRNFIALLGGAAAWPLGARAQQGGARIPRIGIIDDAPIWDHFRQGLHDLGYIEGRNIAIEYRSAEGDFDRLRQAARELASLPVNILVVYGSSATRAARQATSTIPIVMIGVGDPVRARFVTNLARPGGNVTGTTSLGPELIGKRIEILKECAWLGSGGFPMESRQRFKSCLPGRAYHRCSGIGPTIDFRSDAHE
jgi:putative tryptophan/tyrosine transport system substrate-binding protein